MASTAPHGDGIRVWHQSITDLTRLVSYRDALTEHARTVCGPDVTVDVHGVAPGTYPEGAAPIRTTCYPWAHSLLSVQIVRNAILAEQQGYDAFACSCFLDPALREVRSAVDIPVVSVLESSLLNAPVVAGSVGLLGLGGAMAADMLALARGYGLSDRIAAMVPITPELTELDLENSALDLENSANHHAVLDRVRDAGRRALVSGAELLVPAEGMLNTLLVRLGVTEVDGVPVLDSYGLLLRQAEMYVRLWRGTGLRTSRHGRYARAPESLREHLTAVTAATLADGPATPGESP
jgi:Asp/Glu/hydantoin racemase